jgi:hypothetical protein
MKQCLPQTYKQIFEVDKLWRMTEDYRTVEQWDFQ